MLPTFPVAIRHGICKVYAEAVRGDHYHIDVVNRLDRRIGLVIAVDGRNIISGAKSWLKHTERMYILEPYGSGKFSGWRTAPDRINRFYFTHVPDAYAAAFGDESAMGVIAVAVYPEAERYVPPLHAQIGPSQTRDHDRKSADATGPSDAWRASPSAPGNVLNGKAMPSEEALEKAGTGYGRPSYAPSRIVAFEPEKKAVETIYLKYEWRSTLCRRGIVHGCHEAPPAPNRLLDDAVYAPPPPGRHQP
jgi:hypothetical protein